MNDIRANTPIHEVITEIEFRYNAGYSIHTHEMPIIAQMMTALQNSQPDESIDIDELEDLREKITRIEVICSE